MSAQTVGHDPLQHGGRPQARAAATTVLVMIGAVALHAAAVAGSYVIGMALAMTDTVRPGDDKLTVAIVQPPPPEPPPPPPVVEPEPPKPPKAKPKRVVRPEPQPSVPEPQPAPDPVDVAQVPDPAGKPVARRIVGLSMESTTTGGSGPQMAVGNTRMGSTKRVASDPSNLQRLAGETVPPRRLHAPKPTYPRQLRLQGLEADVRVEAEIDTSGRVTRVIVIRGSGQDEFDRAAVAAAKHGVYEPAKRNGVPFTTTIRFTVRFRLT